LITRQTHHHHPIALLIHTPARNNITTPKHTPDLGLFLYPSIAQRCIWPLDLFLLPSAISTFPSA
jgi:hypothetical protein